MCCFSEIFGVSRKQSAIINCILVILGSLPCALGYNVWSGFQPLGAGSTVLDLEDFIVSNLLLPVGSLIYLLFCTSKWGWGFKNYQAEANKGGGLKVPDWVRVIPYVYPAVAASGINCPGTDRIRQEQKGQYQTRKKIRKELEKKPENTR